MEVCTHGPTSLHFPHLQSPATTLLLSISMSLAFLELVREHTSKKTHSSCLSLSEVTFLGYITYLWQLLKWEGPFSNGFWKQPPQIHRSHFILLPGVLCHRQSEVKSAVTYLVLALCTQERFSFFPPFLSFLPFLLPFFPASRTESVAKQRILWFR